MCKSRSEHDSQPISVYRSSLCIDLLLWLPMTHIERSRCIRWRLGWLPGGKPKECILHPGQHWSRRHLFECLHVHDRLFLPSTIDDPISFLLNLLPLRKPRRPESYASWVVRWPLLCQILHELDHFFHDEFPPPIDDPGQKMLKWILKR